MIIGMCVLLVRFNFVVFSINGEKCFIIIVGLSVLTRYDFIMFFVFVFAIEVFGCIFFLFSIVLMFVMKFNFLNFFLIVVVVVFIDVLFLVFMCSMCSRSSCVFCSFFSLLVLLGFWYVVMMMLLCDLFWKIFWFCLSICCVSLSLILCDVFCMSVVKGIGVVMLVWFVNVCMVCILCVDVDGCVVCIVSVDIVYFIVFVMMKICVWWCDGVRLCVGGARERGRRARFDFVSTTISCYI